MFLVASGAILLSGAAVVALVLTRSLREQAISDRMAIDRRPDLFAADGPSRAVA